MFFYFLHKNSLPSVLRAFGDLRMVLLWHHWEASLLEPVLLKSVSVDRDSALKALSVLHH